ncbi:MAG TPA: discoidin domain-containing protein [Candidatus Hydrogenedentes bacterium]|nr:discoidin domain-containing protein [Candidatus Hydrogenedentota bacterium]
MKLELWKVLLSVAVVFMALPVVAQDAAKPAAPAGDMEELKIELPEPFFGGTPLDYWSTNLEPEDYKDRPPVMVPKGTTLISKGKAVTSSCKTPTLGDLKQITDGDKDYAKSSLVELSFGVQWVQIDLGAAATIYDILVWHFHEGKRVYFDMVVQISDDPEFKTGVTTVYNNDHDNSAGLGVGKDKEFIENNKGRLIKVDGVKGRYVRLYSNGNTANELNNYVEVEVFGK